MATFQTRFGNIAYPYIVDIKETVLDAVVPVLMQLPLSLPEEATRQVFAVTNPVLPTEKLVVGVKSIQPNATSLSSAVTAKNPISISITRESDSINVGNDRIGLFFTRAGEWARYDTGVFVSFSKNDSFNVVKTFENIKIPNAGEWIPWFYTETPTLTVPTIRGNTNIFVKALPSAASDVVAGKYVEPWELGASVPVSQPGQRSSSAVFEFSWSKPRIYIDEEVILTITRNVYSQLTNNQPIGSGTAGTDVLLFVQDTANNTGPNQPWTYKTDLSVQVPKFIQFNPSDKTKTIKMKFSSLGTAYFDVIPAFVPNDGAIYRRVNQGVPVWYPASQYSFDMTTGKLGNQNVQVIANQPYHISVTRSNPQLEEVVYVGSANSLQPTFTYFNGTSNVSGNFLPLRFVAGETTKINALTFSSSGSAKLKISKDMVTDISAIQSTTATFASTEDVARPIFVIDFGAIPDTKYTADAYTVTAEANHQSYGLFDYADIVSFKIIIPSYSQQASVGGQWYVNRNEFVISRSAQWSFTSGSNQVVTDLVTRTDLVDVCMSKIQGDFANSIFGTNTPLQYNAQTMLGVQRAINVDAYNNILFKDMTDKAKCFAPGIYYLNIRIKNPLTLPIDYKANSDAMAGKVFWGLSVKQYSD